MSVGCLRSARRASESGLTLLEVVLTLAIVAAVSGIALPLTSAALDEVRTGMGARYLEARIFGARMQAIRRSAPVALRFVPEEDDFRFAEYADGNGNGVRTAEIAAGLDIEVVPGRLLRDSFAGVKFGLQGNVPEVDGVRTAERSDGVRVGSARILSLGPDGTATSGTLYLHGRRSQYAVRVLGATGRTRLLRFDPGSGRWITR